eukprot:828954-Rhodomonas_salina.2
MALGLLSTNHSSTTTTTTTSYQQKYRGPIRPGRTFVPLLDLYPNGIRRRLLRRSTPVTVGRRTRVPSPHPRGQKAIRYY